jgi:hypothetical protein
VLSGYKHGDYYLVDLSGDRRTCTCTDFMTAHFHAGACKHILFAEICLSYVAQQAAKWTREELDASLFKPSRVEPLPAAPKQRFSAREQSELRAAAASGKNVNLDFC